MGYSLNLNQTEEEQKNMSTFSYYNYQFSRLVPSSSVQDEFSTTTVSTTVHADGNFARKQEILSEILAADSDGSRKIVFRSPRGKKRHLHSYLVPYADGMAVMKISNRRAHVVEKEDFTKETHDEFPSCIVVIDNRPGIQRIVIEKRALAFAGVDQVQGILQSTLRRLLRPYGLSVSIDQLHTRSAFWDVANDAGRYPLGFRRISFRLPHLNLERLRKAMESYMTMARESYGSDLSWSQESVKGGRLKLDENDTFQASLVGALMEEVGGNNVITLLPNGKGRKPVHVGKDNYLTGDIAADVFDRLAESDSAGRDEAMERIKAFTSRFID